MPDRKLEITTNIGCIYSCSYCPQARLTSAYKSKDTMMSLSTYIMCVDKIPLSIPIHFSGFSEPLLNPWSLCMMMNSKLAGHDIIVFTNLLPIDSVHIKVFKDISPKKLCVHVPDKAMRISKAEIDDWCHKITLLVRNDIEFELVYVSNDEMASGKIENAVEWSKMPIVDQMEITRGEDEAIDKLSSCYGARYNQNVLLPDGSIYLCCQDYGLQYRLGNLLEDDYEDLFKTDIYKRAKCGELDLCRRCNRSRASEEGRTPDGQKITKVLD